jgi:hypothetical protein
MGAPSTAIDLAESVLGILNLCGDGTTPQGNRDSPRRIPVEQISLTGIFSGGRHPPFTTTPVADSQRWRSHCPKEASAVNIETPQPQPPPSIAERAIDTATDVSRGIEEVTAALRIALDRLQLALARAERPGQPVARLRAVTREAPLTSLFIAFLLGVTLARRR